LAVFAMGAAGAGLIAVLLTYTRGFNDPNAY
jgi:hypothetical protein